MLLFLVVGLVLVLLISRKLVRYATTISPLEASRRVAVSEATQARTRFGVLEWLALVIGGYKIVAWITDFSLASHLTLTEEDSDDLDGVRSGRFHVRSCPGFRRLAAVRLRLGRVAGRAAAADQRAAQRRYLFCRRQIAHSCRSNTCRSNRIGSRVFF